MLKQAKNLRRIARLISRSALGPGPAGLNNLQDRLFQVYPEVAEAIVSKRPVVALESTIITHGMPYPENLRVAKEVEKIVKNNGAIPATIAVLSGKIHVGLSEANLERLAQDTDAVKTSRRDLPHVISKGLTGGTTVSSTMIAANATGIPVFVTGGIGGVHRGAQSTFDISTDLTELGKTPMAVVCAGAKSILDIELTLEYLETQGVLVATYGDSLDFPAFFTPKSGFKSVCNIQTPEEAAKLIDANLSLKSSSGIVLAVPISKKEAASGEIIEKAIQKALQEASDSGIKSKEVTPFLLKRVNELTQGQSLQANMALVKNNAKIGSLIAVELCRIQKLKEKKAVESQGKVPGFPDSTRDWNRQRRPVVIGGSNVDFIATAESIVLEASNPGKVRMSFGGVGRNMAECLARLGMRPLFVSSIGSDPLGAMLLKHCEEARMVTRGIYTSKVNHTGTYSAILSQNDDFHAAVGDMDIHKVISPDHIAAFEEPIKHAPLVMLDGNITEEAIDHACYFCAANHIPVWFEPTCIMKAEKPFRSDAWHNITYISPNLKELRTMSSAIMNDELQKSNLPPHITKDDKEKDRPLEDIITESLHLCKPLLKHIHCIIVTLGKHGALICRDTSADTPFPTAHHMSRVSAARQHSLVSAQYFPAVGPGSHVPGGNVTGAGDSFAAAMASCIIQGHSPVICVKAGILAAQYSLQSQDAISPAVFPENFTPENVESCIPWDANDISMDIF